MPLTPYRRHITKCPHKGKGQAFSLCACPIWCYGTVNGQGVRQSLRTSDSARAIRELERIERDGIEPRTPAIAEAVEAFLADCRGRNLRESTLDSYQKTLEHLTKHLGRSMVGAVDVVALDAYRATRHIAPSTWRKELETIRALFTFCLERDWCERNPAKKLKMPKTEDLATQPFTGPEVRKLLDATDAISSDDPGETDYVRRRARALVYVLLYSGLRISDTAPLERWKLEPETRHLTLRILKNGVRLKVLLHPAAVKALASLPSANPKYFFWSGNGDIETCIKNMRRTIQRLGTIAGVHAHPHRFRDTFAVELLTNGADIRTVQKLLGHTSVRTTEKHYAHFVAAHQALLDSAASTLDFERGPGRPLAVHPVVNRRRNS